MNVTHLHYYSRSSNPIWAVRHPSNWYIIIIIIILPAGPVGYLSRAAVAILPGLTSSNSGLTTLHLSPARPFVPNAVVCLCVCTIHPLLQLEGVGRRQHILSCLNR